MTHRLTTGRRHAAEIVRDNPRLRGRCHRLAQLSDRLVDVPPTPPARRFKVGKCNVCNVNAIYTREAGACQLRCGGEIDEVLAGPVTLAEALAFVRGPYVHPEGTIRQVTRSRRV